MRRMALGTAAAVAVLLVAIFAWPTPVQSKDQNAPNGLASAKPPTPLPISQVVLFSSGVGYFHREGEVDGAARIDLSFPASDINDLLKSLVLQDLGGGRVSAVSYDSHDPIDKTLRSFALNLNNNPGFAQILNQARGEKIEVTIHDKQQKDAKPTKQTGIIVGM